MLRHILIKLTNIKHKERILKAVRAKQQVIYKVALICLTAELSAETLQARREWQDIFKVLRGKIYNQDYSSQETKAQDQMTTQMKSIKHLETN